MNFRKHTWSLGAALSAFLLLSVMSGPLGLTTLVVLFILLLVATALYFHYHRRQAREDLEPVAPYRDDRVIPQEVREFVIARDNGICQLQYAGICLYDQEIQVDHIWPWSRGGSSKDPANLQAACGPCNRHKGAKVPL